MEAKGVMGVLSPSPSGEGLGLGALRPSEAASPHPTLPREGREIRDQPNALVTPRCVSTEIRLARYAALACRSLESSLASTFTAAAASGVKLFVSACSSPVCRNTPLPPPVTATRTPLSVCATQTPTRAKREAGCLNFM